MGEPVFFDEESSNMLIQGSLKNTWLLSGLGLISTQAELIRGKIKRLEKSDQVNVNTALGISKGIYPPIFHCFAKKGLYVIRLEIDQLSR